VGKSSGGIGTFEKLPREAQEFCAMKCSRSVISLHAGGQVRGRTLSHFVDFTKEERTVGILRGGFAISHEPSDRSKVQGRYASIPKRFEAQEGQVVDLSHKGRRIYT
jgi:hypothetical protein